MAKTKFAVADDNWRAFERAFSAGHEKYIKISKKCNDFYLGDQWEIKDRQKLEGEGRPVLTINEILRVVNAFLGELSVQRADMAFKPRRDANKETAEALSKLFLQIQDNNRYKYVEGEVFADGLIQDRGYFDVRLDFSDNAFGEIRITSEHPKHILLDPQASDYDPRTWNEVIKEQWKTVDDIKMLYGKKAAQDVEAIASVGRTFGSESIRFQEQDTFGEEDLSRISDEPNPDSTVRKVRIIDRQYRKLSPMRFFVDNLSGDMRPVPVKFSDERAERVAKGADLQIIKKMVKRVRWTVTADHVVLHDDWSPYKNFTIVPFFPFFRRGKPSGIVRHMLSPQEQFNKVESQILHVVNTTANSGWMVPVGSLQNMTTEELESKGAETGLVVEFHAKIGEPTKIKPNQVPTGLDLVSRKAQENIATISGAASLLGTESDEVSGVVLRIRKAGAMTQLQVPFEALNRTRRLLAEIMLDLVQEFYTETRVLRVTNWETPQPTEEQIILNGMTPEGEIINDLTVGEYDVVITTQPSRDTFMETQFAEALQMREAGVFIPDDIIIEASNLSNKSEIAERVRQQQGTSEPTEEEQEMAQIQLEMEMKNQELLLHELGAKVGLLQVQAAKVSAEADNLGNLNETEGQRVAQEVQVKMVTLEADIQKFAADLQNKLQLATIHTRSKQDLTLHSNLTKKVIEEIKSETAKAVAALKPKPTAK